MARSLGSSPEARIDGLTHNSLEAGPGKVFFALPGAKVDGTSYAGAAFAAGAPLIVAERDVEVPAGHELFVVDDARQAMADVAVFLNKRLLTGTVLVGVTGTNGKTTTTLMVRSILAAGGLKAAAIGTTGFVAPDGRTTKLTNTTPDILAVIGMLRELAEEKCCHVAMEVSSQGVVQRRVSGLPFRVGVFTNLTPEHMETHGSFERYLEAKLTFFREAGPTAARMGMPFFGCVYAQDQASVRFAEVCPGPPFSFGISMECDVRATEIQAAIDGSRFYLFTPTGGTWVQLGVPGTHNVLNALAAASAASALGLSPATIARGLAELTSVAGRLQRVPGTSRQVFIDYAHSSDALEKLLTSCRDMLGNDPGKLVVVFGCGGDRDRTKRPRMGRVAATLADRCYITSDNPRSESPTRIIEEIVAGVDAGERWKVCVVADRREAIEAAVRESTEKDLVVIAGKGHEDYQILGEEIVCFDDLAEATKVVEELDSAIAT